MTTKLVTTVGIWVIIALLSTIVVMLQNNTVVPQTQFNQTNNPWMEVGTFAEYDKLIKNYSPTIFQWGVKYNTISIAPVIIQTWNRGVRIFSEFTYAMGDNAASFTPGRAMFTRGTDDEESKNCFYHRYVDVNFKPTTSNACSDHVVVYVRKL